jgi:hypothetical protein
VILHPRPAMRFQRQVSAARAVCSNPARTDLCGGRGVNSRPYRDCGRGERATVPPMPICAAFCLYVSRSPMSLITYEGPAAMQGLREQRGKICA